MWSLNFILYSEDFPAGGDFYNFMRRMGPVIEYKIKDNQFVSFRYLWTHISNGQGMKSFNPSYDAQGISISLKNHILIPMNNSK